MRKKRVLIVEGEEVSRIALKRSFETREPDYQVVIAPDGFKALGRLVQRRVDLVLLSCH
jgi:CheY-like chemotaxis protein